jgi:hypothetical protein
MKGSFLVIQNGSNQSMMHCLCCGERHPLCTRKINFRTGSEYNVDDDGVSNMTIGALTSAFVMTHKARGCSQKKYERRKLMEEL